MARGGSRPNAGRPRKSLEWHRLHGTIRPARHTKPASNVYPLGTKPAVGVDWWPAESDVTALGPHARSLLDATLSLYQLSTLEGEQVLLALRSLTRCEQLESAIDAVGVADGRGKPSALLSALSREQRVFLSAWAAIRFERT